MAKAYAIITILGRIETNQEEFDEAAEFESGRYQVLEKDTYIFDSLKEAVDDFDKSTQPRP